MTEHELANFSLIKAVIAGDLVEVIHLHKVCKANLNCLGGIPTGNPLIYALWYNHHDIVLYLLDNGATMYEFYSSWLKIMIGWKKQGRGKPK